MFQNNTHVNNIPCDVELSKRNYLSIDEQKRLSSHPSLIVRRALAKNQTIHSEIANKLLFDITVNVSYAASKNRNCTKERNFRDDDKVHPCVICEKDELNIDCTSCLKDKYVTRTNKRDSKWNFLKII